MNFSKTWSQVSWLNWEVCCLGWTSQEPGPKCHGSMEKSVASLSSGEKFLRTLGSYASWLNYRGFICHRGFLFFFFLVPFLLFFVLSQLFFVGYSSRFLVPISNRLFFFFKIEPITIWPGFCLLVLFCRGSRVLPWSCIGGPYLLFILILCLWLPFLSQIKCTNPNQESWLTKSVYSSRLTHLRLRMWSQMPVPQCSGSIRKSVVCCPKSLVPSILAHERPGPKCPGLTGMSVLLRCFFFSNL